MRRGAGETAGGTRASQHQGVERAWSISGPEQRGKDERIFIGLMTSDRQLKASIEGLK